jgi:hypothetical protein
MLVFDVQAGPCYRNSSVSADTMGCRFSIIKPLGLCPSAFDTKGTPCSSLEKPEQIVIGTSGNEFSGTMDQGPAVDPCWLSYQCETVYTTIATRTPMGFVPILKQACQIKGNGSPLGGWNAFHALGQGCVRGPEGPVAVTVP